MASWLEALIGAIVFGLGLWVTLLTGTVLALRKSLSSLAVMPDFERVAESAARTQALDGDSQWSLQHSEALDSRREARLRIYQEGQG